MQLSTLGLQGRTLRKRSLFGLGPVGTYSQQPDVGVMLNSMRDFKDAVLELHKHRRRGFVLEFWRGFAVNVSLLLRR